MGGLGCRLGPFTILGQIPPSHGRAKQLSEFYSCPRRITHGHPSINTIMTKPLSMFASDLCPSLNSFHLPAVKLFLNMTQAIVYQNKAWLDFNYTQSHGERRQ